MSDEENVGGFDVIGQKIADGLKGAGMKLDGTDKLVNDLASDAAFVSTETMFDTVQPPTTEEKKVDEPNKEGELSDIQKLVAEALGTAQPVKEEATPVAEAKPTVEEKKPYTLEELRELDYEQIDTSRIPPEGQPIYKALQKIVTKKSQELSEQKRKAEEAQREQERNRIVLETKRLLAQQEEQRRLENEKRLREEESLLSPDELEKRRTTETISTLENRLAMLEGLRQQELNVKAIESEYAYASGKLELPTEAKDIAMKLIWAQQAMEDVNGVQRTPMVDILTKEKDTIMRAIGGASAQENFGIKEALRILNSNPKIMEEFKRQLISDYFKQKQNGATVVPQKQTDIQNVKKTGKITFDDMGSIIANDPRMKGII